VFRTSNPLISQKCENQANPNLTNRSLWPTINFDISPGGRSDDARHGLLFRRLHGGSARPRHFEIIENGLPDIKRSFLFRIVPVDAVERDEAYKLRNAEHVRIVRPADANGYVHDQSAIYAFRIRELLRPSEPVDVAAMRGDDHQIVCKKFQLRR
jgi:hypothetical protein